jgi:hypothetical protein
MIDLPNFISPLGLSNTDRQGFSSFAGWRSHEFRPDWVSNIVAKNGIDSGVVTLSQSPASHFLDGGKLFRAACAPKRDANTRLVK